MPKLTFALEAGAPKRLEVSWKLGFKETRVLLDGKELALIPDKKALQAGREIPLPDGSTLRVAFTATTFGGQGISLARNGEPLPGSNGDPETMVKTAAYVLYFLATLNFALGVISLAVQSSFLDNLGVGLGSVIMAAIMAVLGFFTFRRSLVAVIIAIVLILLDAVGGMVLSAMAGGKPGFGGIVMKVLFTVMLIRGAQAIRTLKRKEAVTA